MDDWVKRRERERESTLPVLPVWLKCTGEKRERENGKQLVFNFKIPFKVAGLGVSMTIFKNVSLHRKA